MDSRTMGVGRVVDGWARWARWAWCWAACAASALVAVLLAGCGSIVVGEQAFLQAAKEPWPQRDVDALARFETASLAYSDGVVARGLWLRTPGARGTVLFFQGNGELVDREGVMRLWQFQQLGLDALVLDRRGSGQTPGVPSVAALMRDALEAFDHARAHSRGGPLVVHGFSLGTTIAAELVRQRRPDALVIEGGISTVGAYLDVHVPWYLRPLVALSPTLQQVNPAEALRAYDGPLLIAVGEQDPATVPSLSRQLAATATSARKELLVLPGVGHYALTSVAGFKAYRQFLERALTPTAAP